MTDPDALIAALDLRPHPEGGHYRETWRAEAPEGQRPPGTAILFLLKAGEVSHWHRVDATEIWHYHSGAPLILRIALTDAGPAVPHVLGPDVLAGQSPQGIVPPHAWQSAVSTGAYSLVSCTVSPGFRFDGFELAPPGFSFPDA
jgi:uncharacterized protein